MPNTDKATKKSDPRVDRITAMFNKDSDSSQDTHSQNPPTAGSLFVEAVLLEENQAAPDS